MRDAIWNLVRSRIPEGQILPWWALAIRAVLYPLDFLYWRMSKATGYQWDADVWLIDGVRVSGQSIRRLAKSQGGVYLVTRTGDVLTFEKVGI